MVDKQSQENLACKTGRPAWFFWRCWLTKKASISFWGPTTKHIWWPAFFFTRADSNSHRKSPYLNDRFCTQVRCVLSCRLDESRTFALAFDSQMIRWSVFPLGWKGSLWGNPNRCHILRSMARNLCHRMLCCDISVPWRGEPCKASKPLCSQSTIVIPHPPLTAVLSTNNLSRFFTGCRIDNCEACFSKDFCTKCKSGFYLHRGRCFDKCPEGFAPLEDSMECGGKCKC